MIDVISTFEKAVVCNSLHTDTHLHRCTPITFLYSTLIEMRRHKIRCNCKDCASKASQVMNLIRMTPQITSPRAIDKEIDEDAFGNSSFNEGWEICEKIFPLIRTVHHVSHGWNPTYNQCNAHASNIDKLTTFFPTKVEIQNRANPASEISESNPWKDAETSDDDYPSLG